MGKHLDKRQIFAMIEQCKKAKESAENDKVTFFGMAVICNYVLWKYEKFGQSRLAKYNDDYKEVIRGHEDDATELNDRLWNKAEFQIDVTEFTGKDLGYTNCKYLNSKIDKMAYHNNLINFESAKYLVGFFNVMMDYGYGKKRLERLKDQIHEILEADTSIYFYERVLREKAGIQVERPF